MATAEMEVAGVRVRLRVWMTPASETEETESREETRKCWADGSHAREEGRREEEGMVMTWRRLESVGTTNRRMRKRTQERDEDI